MRRGCHRTPAAALCRRRPSLYEILDVKCRVVTVHPQQSYHAVSVFTCLREKTKKMLFVPRRGREIHDAMSSITSLLAPPPISVREICTRFIGLDRNAHRWSFPAPFFSISDLLSSIFATCPLCLRIDQAMLRWTSYSPFLEISSLLYIQECTVAVRAALCQGAVVMWPIFLLSCRRISSRNVVVRKGAVRSKERQKLHPQNPHRSYAKRDTLKTTLLSLPNFYDKRCVTPNVVFSRWRRKPLSPHLQ